MSCSGFNAWENVTCVYQAFDLMYGDFIDGIMELEAYVLLHQFISWVGPCSDGEYNLMQLMVIK